MIGTTDGDILCVQSPQDKGVLTGGGWKLITQLTTALLSKHHVQSRVLDLGDTLLLTSL